jgi:hypothetical protein
MLFIALCWILFTIRNASADSDSSSHAEPDKCLYFDGKNDVVNAGNIKVFNDARFITVEMWVRIDTFSAWKTFFCKFQDLNNRIQFQEFSEPGKIAVCVNNKANVKKEGNQAYYYTPQTEVTIGDWFHLAMVFDGTQEEQNRLKLYINGMNRSLERDKNAKGVLPDRMPSTMSPLLLGAQTDKGAYGYNGLMDEVRIWSIARTDDQIRSCMNSSLKGDEPGLQLYYQMSNDSTKAETLVDLSSAKNNARLVNFDLTACFINRDYATPTVQSSLAFVKEPGIDAVQVLWKRGSGSSNVVFATDRDTIPPTLLPGETYQAESVFGKGSRVGTSHWYCVYNGNDNAAAITGLQPSTNYKFLVADYNGGPGQEQYFMKADSGNMISLSTKPLSLKCQSIQFDSPGTVTIDMKEVPLKVAASSALPVTITSSNPDVAEVTNDKLLIKAVGTTIITALQYGNEEYAPAETVTFVFTVKNIQTVQNSTTPPNDTQLSTNTPSRFFSAKWWSKKKNILIVTGGALVLGGVIAILVSTKDHPSESSPVITDRPPSDPVLSQ